jgi:NAD(P)-dependent dehydrogenase (short-subunit alcohol dehydrogenase family)
VKHALVTGSCVRTGRAIALRLARDGWHVCIHGKPGSAQAAEDTARTCRDAGGTASVHLADISDLAGCQKLSDSIDLPSLELLVHNVGIYATGPLLETDPSTWDRILSTNLTAPFHLTRMLAPLMRPGSSIVTLGYVGISKLPGTTRTGAYSISKTALLSLTKCLALELGPRGIRANMVSPGQLENSVDLPADIDTRVPLGRAGRVDEIADIVAWLASDQASYVTGQDLEVAGGLMMALRGQ